MGFLDEILEELEASTRDAGYLPPPPPRDRPLAPRMEEAIRARRGGQAMVVEFKRVSPGYRSSPLPQLSIPAFASMAERSGATALSCLACEPRFGGSPQDVAQLASQTHLPVLFKDFVTDFTQVEAARRSGASAVLLIARLETERRLRRPLREIADRARSVGLEVVLELHLPEDVAVARQVPANVYGVNVRDLDTLKMERTRAHRTLEEAQRLRPLLGLSGIQSRTDVEWFERRGTDGFLVGTSVARSADPTAFLAELKGPALGSST
ncbi:MAG: hypothetical protein WCA77_08045 [Thermoplasmata archaeon]